MLDVLVISRRNTPRFLDLSPEEVHCQLLRFTLRHYGET